MQRKTLKKIIAVCLSFSLISVPVFAAENVAPGSAVDCGISAYKATTNLIDADKSDSTQANTQTSTDITDSTYSTSLLQSAEWTDKAAGEAALNIHYEAEFKTATNAPRSLYVFTSCTYHSFTEKIAITNIIELLNYNEYVDVIMIGTTNSISGTTKWNITAASMFSLKASDFEKYNDGVEDDNFDKKGNYTGSATDTKAAMISKVLRTYLNSSAGCTETSACDYGTTCTENNFADINYAYGLGQDGTGTGMVDLLYDESTDDVKYPNASFFEGADGFSHGYNSAAELALTFGGARHAGVYFSLYYIAQYIDIIENNYGSGSFSSTVGAIFNSFDSFNTAYQNSISIVYKPADLYKTIKEYIGLDMENDSMSLSDMQSSANGCWNALSVLKTYSSDGRYISLVPDSDDESCYDFSKYAADGNYGENVTTEQTENMLLFALTLMAPSIVESEARETVSGWIANGTKVTIEDNLQTYNENIYGYSKGLSELNILESVYTTNSVTITTTITSEFEITDTSAITVVNSGDTGSYFSYDDPVITTNGDGTTTVSIDFYNLSADDAWAMDISIPVSLKDNSEFRTSADEFKDTNGSITTAEVKSVTTDSPYNRTETLIETVTVASPKLYKAPGSLTITKEVSGDATTAQKEEDSYSFTVQLGETISGTYTATYSDGTESTITFENGEITKVDNEDAAAIFLKGSQSVTISGLPGGTSYKVTEDTSDITGTYEVWVNGSEGTEASGTITDGETAEVIFDNHFETIEKESTDGSTSAKADDDSTTTTATTTTTTSSATTAKNVQTGDYGNIVLWISLVWAAGAGLTGVILYSRKKRYRK